MAESSYRGVIVTLLRDVLRNILTLEQIEIDAGLSITELHVIEAVGDGEPHFMGQVARKLRVTMPALTEVVDRLEEKGLINRQRSGNDRRRVAILLTEEGREALALHRRFHDRMVETFLRGTNESNKPELLDSLRRLRDFFRARSCA